MADDDDESPPTMGVREPRKPKPPTLSPGAEAVPDREADAETEANAARACLAV